MTSPTDPETGGPARLRSDRGAFTIEMVIVFPVAVMLIFLAVQAAVYYHGKTVALAAAQEGARASAAYQATNEEGRVAARQFAQNTGSDAIANTQVLVDRKPQARQVVVEVTGTIPTFLPGWDPTVSQSASRTIEGYTRPEQVHDRNEPGDKERPASW